MNIDFGSFVFILQLIALLEVCGFVLSRLLKKSAHLSMYILTISFKLLATSAKPVWVRIPTKPWMFVNVRRMQENCKDSLRDMLGSSKKSDKNFKRTLSEVRRPST